MRSAMLCVAACLASLTGTAPAVATTAKDIANWSTYCSSGLTCLLSYQDPETGEFGMLEFRRTGALNAEIELRLSKPPRFGRNLDPEGAFRLTVDGEEALILPVRQLALDADGDELISRDQASVLILLEAMKSGTTLQLQYEGVVGKHSAEMNLDGFRGSLFFIDDAQGRRGRNDALFAVGQKVPKGLGSKDIKSLDDIPASIRADFTVKDGSCTEGFEPDDLFRYNGFDISIDGVRLVLVPCSNAGAYNQTYALYRGYYEGGLTRISFPDVEEGKPSISEVAYNVDFDPTTRIMTSFVKDNSMGVCGLWHKWRLTEERHLVLLERRGWYECDDSYEGPEEFPLEWPANKQN